MKPAVNMMGGMLLTLALPVLGQQSVYGQCKLEILYSDRLLIYC
jgi:hypothetical protein